MRVIKFVLLIAMLTNSYSTWAVRPFVTDDARIIDVYQFELETWTEFGKSSSENTLGQHIMAGYSFTDWFELIGGFGVGHDLKQGEFLVANPVIQPKFLIWQAYDDGFPGLALAGGYTIPYGQGAYFDDATGYYFMAMITSRQFNDWLQLHLNLGKIYAKEAGEATAARNYWGIGIDVGIIDRDYRFIAEAYAGDPFEALGPDLSFQSGFRWLKSDFVNYDFTFGAQPELSENGMRNGRWEYWGQIGVRLLFDTFRGKLGQGAYEGAKGLLNPRSPAKYPEHPKPEFPGN